LKRPLSQRRPSCGSRPASLCPIDASPVNPPLLLHIHAGPWYIAPLHQGLHVHRPASPRVARRYGKGSPVPEVLRETLAHELFAGLAQLPCRTFQPARLSSASTSPISFGVAPTQPHTTHPPDRAETRPVIDRRSRAGLPPRQSDGGWHRGAVLTGNRPCETCRRAWSCCEGTEPDSISWLGRGARVY
jgi:hypothetical protein